MAVSVSRPVTDNKGRVVPELEIPPVPIVVLNLRLAFLNLSVLLAGIIIS
jgi:hypothetical protein